jgi:energy-coupling factor transporter ATP-binding protein EcfA2
MTGAYQDSNEAETFHTLRVLGVPGCGRTTLLHALQKLLPGSVLASSGWQLRIPAGESVPRTVLVELERVQYGFSAELTVDGAGDEVVVLMPFYATDEANRKGYEAAARRVLEMARIEIPAGSVLGDGDNT